LPTEAIARPLTLSLRVAPTANPAMTDQELDLIIVTIYVIIVVYVFKQAIDALDDIAKVTLVKKDLEAQLERETFEGTMLKDLLEISFRFSKKDENKFEDQPKEMTVTFKNKSTHEVKADADPLPLVTIKIDWDSCSITDYNKRARRVIRLTPDDRLQDLDQEQVPSVVPPERTLSARITAEDVLKLDPEKNTMAPDKPLLDILGLKEASKDKKEKKASKEIKEMWAKFDAEKAPLTFSLRLLVYLCIFRDGSEYKRPYWICCNFTVTNLPWTNYLPWVPKK
jgi:hypothetical protein